MLDSDRRGIDLRSCWNLPRWRAFGAAWFSSTCWVYRGGTRLCLRGRRLRFTSKCFINIRPKTTLGLKHRYPFNYFQMIKLPHSPLSESFLICLKMKLQKSSGNKSHILKKSEFQHLKTDFEVVYSNISQFGVFCFNKIQKKGRFLSFIYNTQHGKTVNSYQ